jgi:hypothetical protein
LSSIDSHHHHHHPFRREPSFNTPDLFVGCVRRDDDKYWMPCSNGPRKNRS